MLREMECVEQREAYLLDLVDRLHRQLATATAVTASPPEAPSSLPSSVTASACCATSASPALTSRPSPRGCTARSPSRGAGMQVVPCAFTGQASQLCVAQTCATASCSMCAPCGACGSYAGQSSSLARLASQAFAGNQPLRGRAPAVARGAPGAPAAPSPYGRQLSAPSLFFRPPAQSHGGCCATAPPSRSTLPSRFDFRAGSRERGASCETPRAVRGTPGRLLSVPRSALRPTPPLPGGPARPASASLQRLPLAQVMLQPPQRQGSSARLSGRGDSG